MKIRMDWYKYTFVPQLIKDAWNSLFSEKKDNSFSLRVTSLQFPRMYIVSLVDFLTSKSEAPK